MSLFLIAFGLLGLLYSVYYYLSEVKPAPYIPMGVDMSFSQYWMLSSGLFCFGVCSFFTLSLFWAVIPTIGMYMLSFPLRTLLSNQYLGVDYKEEKPKKGFKEFEQKINDKDDVSPSD
jgi:hypothetical protein